MNKESLTLDPTAGNFVFDFLKLHQDMSFNIEVYKATCADINSGANQKLIEAQDLPRKTTLVKMLATVPVNMMGHFVKLYRMEWLMFRARYLYNLEELCSADYAFRLERRYKWN